MESWDMHCPGCFTRKGTAAVCPYCGYDESERRSPLVLPHRSVLNGQFLVGRVLGKPGGFGITYLGWDINLATPVAIKEYLPRDYAGRDSDHASVMAHSREDAGLFRFGLEQFLIEARTLARFDHPNVVRTRSFFEQNGTAYLVMDYLQGVNLAEYMADKGGPLTEQQATEIMLPILDGLQEVHAKGFLHRDIKPQNIYLTAAGRPILLDFGAARQAMGERSRSLSVVLTQGFAPYEQYHRRGEQGPWTDIYAVAATYYYLLTGEAPPDAAERVALDELAPIASLVPGISSHLSAAIMQGLSLEAELRPQDVFIFRDILAGKAATIQGPCLSAPESPKVGGPPPLPPQPPVAGQVAAEQKPLTVHPPIIQQAPPYYRQPLNIPVSEQPRQQFNPKPSDSAPRPYPTPQAPREKSSSGLWIAITAIVLVVAAAGWYFFGSAATADKKAAPAATQPTAQPNTQPAKKAPVEQEVTNPPFKPLPVETPVQTPAPPPGQPSGPASGGTTVKPAVPPADTTKPPEASPPPADNQPKQPPAVRTQPPATQTPPAATPKRDKGSLW